MPVYNVEAYVGQAIESMLDQSFPDFELIIIDDCSSDRTWDIVQEYARRDQRIKPLQNEQNSRICHTLNRGLDVARGEYVARMDGDDWSHPDRLRLQLDFLEEHPEVVVCGTAIEVCNEDLEGQHTRTYNTTDAEIRAALFRYSPFCHPAIMARTPAMREVGGYNPAFSVSQDYDLYFRLGQLGQLANLPKTLFRLRMRDSSSFATYMSTVQRNTLFIRLKAVVEYGYSMTFGDKLYFAAQSLASLIIPRRLVVRIFNLIRRFD